MESAKTALLLWRSTFVAAISERDLRCSPVDGDTTHEHETINRVIVLALESAWCNMKSLEVTEENVPSTAVPCRRVTIEPHIHIAI